MMDGFFAWLQLGWAWLFGQLTTDWTGIILFLIGSVAIALLIDHLHSRRQTRRARRQMALRCVEADEDVQEQADMVAAGAWWEDSGERDAV